MLRGNLHAMPAPVVHLDWRLLYSMPSEGWPLWMWRLSRLLRAHFMCSRLLVPNGQLHKWVAMQTGAFVVEAVFVGTDHVLYHALCTRVQHDQVWIRKVAYHGSWAEYERDARTIPRLMELVTPAHVDGPLLSGILVKAFSGWGHRIGWEE